MGERMKERERIARELHDTLLQDIEALGLNLRALNQKHGLRNPAHHEIALLDEAAQRSLDDARARVSGLREETRSGSYLTDQLRELADKLALLYPTAFRMVIQGASEQLSAAAVEEILAIGREAILNAFRHARATLITVSVLYSRRSLELKICDDGVGFTAEQRSEAGRSGHFGLVGMRERAQALKSPIAIATLSSGGTMIQLSVAAAICYSRGRPRNWWKVLFTSNP
jgi:signal transduction histidine kinase